MTGRIIITETATGARMEFVGMERVPQPPVRQLPSMDSARSFAIAMHQAHGWAIEEAYEGGK